MGSNERIGDGKRSRLTGLNGLVGIMKSCLSRFSNDNVIMVSNGMVYATLVALVPCMALVYSFLNYLGVVEPVIQFVDEFFVKTFGDSEGISLAGYFDGFMKNAMGLNLISSLSFVVTFLLLVDKLNVTVNRLFHSEVKNNPVVRFLKYLAFMIVSMVIIAVVVGIYTRFSSWFLFLKDLPELSSVQVIAKDLLAKSMIYFALLGVLYLVPDCDVNFYAAAIGAGFGFVLLLVLEFVFKLVVKFSVKASVLYGSLATLMFFFMFLSWIWRIVFTSVVVTDVLNRDFLARGNVAGLRRTGRTEHRRTKP